MPDVQGILTPAQMSEAAGAGYAEAAVTAVEHRGRGGADDQQAAHIDGLGVELPQRCVPIPSGLPLVKGL